MDDRILVLACGSRDWCDYDKIDDALDQAGFKDHPDKLRLVHGGAAGADRMAGEYAEQCGAEVVVCYADWNKYGKQAGYLRNIQMLDMNPELVIAFWDGQSRGTLHTITEARKRNIETVVITHG